MHGLARLSKRQQSEVYCYRFFWSSMLPPTPTPHLLHHPPALICWRLVRERRTCSCYSELSTHRGPQQGSLQPSSPPSPPRLWGLASGLSNWPRPLAVSSRARGDRLPVPFSPKPLSLKSFFSAISESKGSAAVRVDFPFRLLWRVKSRLTALRLDTVALWAKH